jgi:hypothetical protein
MKERYDSEHCKKVLTGEFQSDQHGQFTRVPEDGWLSVRFARVTEHPRERENQNGSWASGSAP